jgi:hypothetical protein
VENQTMRNTSTSSAARDRLFSLGLWTWLAIVEQDAGRLSDGGRAALGAKTSNDSRSTATCRNHLVDASGAADADGPTD